MRARPPFDLKRYLVHVLRKASYRYPERYAAKKAALIPGTKPQHFRCNLCQGSFLSEDSQVDHIEPVVGVNGFSSWDVYIQSLFVTRDRLQVLCKPCHKVKTQAENKHRREQRKLNKK